MKYSLEELKDLLEELKPEIDSNNTNLTIDCPTCGERECSISIKKENHLWGCFRLKKCGDTGNIWHILKKLGKLKQSFFAAKVENIDQVNLSDLFKTNKEEDNVEIDIDLPKISKPVGWKRIVDQSDEYLKNRGFNSQSYCQVGKTFVHPKLKNDYVVFLIEENKEIKGWCARNILSKKYITEYNDNYFLQHGIKNKIKRYRNSDGTDMSKLLYGYDNLDEKNPVPIVLVEGIFDKHAIDEKLLLNDDPFIKTCATFKCFVSDAQIIKLQMKNVKDIILFYDPDVINQIKKNVEKLKIFFNVKVIISKINKDPDELSQEEILQVFENNMYKPEEIATDFIQLKQLKF